MRISDFVLSEPLTRGSRQAEMAKCTYRGKVYQLKIHSAEPKWYNVDDAIRRKTQELRSAAEDNKERLQSELDSLKAKRDDWNERDKISDQYLLLRQNIIRLVKGTHNSHLVPPEEAWTEPIESKGNAVFMVEATPWLESAVWFDEAKPICFHRDIPQEEQYDIIASLADALADLHAAGILHCDLKIDNTLITKDPDGKKKATIIDYDAAIILSELQSRRYPLSMWKNEIGGTYFAPEFKKLFDIVDAADSREFDAFDFSTITPKADVYSLAFTIYEYLYGMLSPSNIMPFKTDDGEILEGVARNDYPAAVEYGFKPNFPSDPAEMSDLIYGALRWMLDNEPANRPTAAQVRDVFKTRDIRMIPAQYCRIDLTTPWDADKIEFVPSAEYMVSKNPLREGVYTVRRKRPDGSLGPTLSRRAADLVRDGLARSLEAPAPAPVEVRAFWESDGMTGDMPACVRRKDGMEGKYVLSVLGGLSTVCTLAELKQKGVVCSDAELLTPWPSDAIHFITSKRVERDLTRGPKHYVVKTFPAQRLTSDEMVAKNYATKAIAFQMWAADEALYAPNPEANMSGVTSITRDSLKGKGYRVMTADGALKLSIDEMLAKGYVKRK